MIAMLLIRILTTDKCGDGGAFAQQAITHHCRSLLPGQCGWGACVVTDQCDALVVADHGGFFQVGDFGVGVGHGALLALWERLTIHGGN